MKHAARGSLHFMLAKLKESKQKKLTVYKNKVAQICGTFLENRPYRYLFYLPLILQMKGRWCKQ